MMARRRASASTRPNSMINKADLNRAGQEAAQRVCDTLPGELRNEVYRQLIFTSIRNSISNAPIPAVDFRTRTAAKNAIEKLGEESEYVLKLEVLQLFDHKAAGMILPGGLDITWAFLPDDPNDRHSIRRLYLGVPVVERESKKPEIFLPRQGHFWMSPLEADVVRFTSDLPHVPAVQAFQHTLEEALTDEESRKKEGEGARLGAAARQLVERLMDLADLILDTLDNKHRRELSSSPPPAQELTRRILHRWPNAKYKWAWGELNELNKLRMYDLPG